MILYRPFRNTLYKKEDMFKCSNHKGITLLNTAYKVLSRIFCVRVCPYVDKLVGQYQAGFMVGKLTINHIYIMYSAGKSCETFEYN